MLPIHQRLADLWNLQKNRPLTNEELDEMALCMEANMNFAFKLSHLYNLSGMASKIDDLEWLSDILVSIDKLEIEYKIKRPAHIKNAD